LQTWDLEDLDAPVASVNAHREIVNCIDGVGLSDGGSKLIATGSKDGLVKLWDPREMTKATAVIGPQDGEAKQDCWSVAFGRRQSDAGRLLATGYDNGDIKMFDLRQMNVIWEKNVKHGICSLEFTKTDSANRLVATTSNARIHVTHVEKPDSMHSESGHKSTIWSVSHLPQNPRIFMTSGGNGNLNLWRHGGKEETSFDSDAGSREVQLLTTSSISNEPIPRFSWHPNKTGLGLCASFDQIVRIIIVTRLSET